MLETDQLQESAPLPESESTAPNLTRLQLETIRDEWLEPILLQLRHQSEEVGRLEERCQLLREERDQLVAERDELHRQLIDRPEPETAADAEQESRFVVFDIIEQLGTSEGAVVAGIAIAMGLWVGIGLLAWIVIG